MSPFEFESIDLQKMPLGPRHQFLLSVVGPRPIALAGTQDADGNDNLAPFSFFNIFGANPPIVAISPANSGKTGEPKHTHLNIEATKEFTISVLSFAQVENANLASAEYPRGVDEFVKAGFTKLKSKLIRPSGVAESPCVLECKLLKKIDIGSGPGSGNLLIGEIVFAHLRKGIRDEAQKLDPKKLDLVARLGGDWYCRSAAGLFELPKPPHNGIGVDALPKWIKESEILSAKHVSRLASVAETPRESGLKGADLEIFERRSNESSHEIERRIAELLDNKEVARAWDWVVQYEIRKGALK
jgi:flavin reductase (DIM6/NTAB) family NADH-FMN oxidoreductase RutF